jgi:ribonucleoside-diphosphate reductase alpha chain
VFFKKRVSYGSEESREVNRAIFEAIYFGALDASCRAAEADGVYESYEGSPMQRDGSLQFDLWDGETQHSGLFDWDSLRARIKVHGVRNSLLVALMPTASSASILGNVESFEPPAELVYKRDVLSGTYLVVVRELIEALEEEGVWDAEMEAALLAEDGSVQNIDRVPQWIKDVFRTAYEVPMEVQLQMRADRERYVCHSASGNAHMHKPTFNDLYRMIMSAFKKKLKTVIYYLRTGASIEARKSGDRTKLRVAVAAAAACSNEPDCLSCQS